MLEGATPRCRSCWNVDFSAPRRSSRMLFSVALRVRRACVVQVLGTLVWPCSVGGRRQKWGVPSCLQPEMLWLRRDEWRPNPDLEDSEGAMGTGPPGWPMGRPPLAARFPRHLNWTSQWSCDIQGLSPNFRSKDERLRDLLTVIQPLSRATRWFLVRSGHLCVHRVLLP